MKLGQQKTIKLLGTNTITKLQLIEYSIIRYITR